MALPNTRPLLKRDGLSRESARALAQFEGATHHLILDDRLTTFYRRTEAGAIEAATATRDDDVWTLSAWTRRAVARLPYDARPLPARRRA